MTDEINERADFARQVAKALNQPTTGKGVDRLAEDLADGPHNHPWLNPLPDVITKAAVEAAERADRLCDEDFQNILLIVEQGDQARLRKYINMLIGLAYSAGTFAGVVKLTEEVAAGVHTDDGNGTMLPERFDTGNEP